MKRLLVWCHCWIRSADPHPAIEVPAIHRGRLRQTTQARPLGKGTPWALRLGLGETVPAECSSRGRHASGAGSQRSMGACGSVLAGKGDRVFTCSYPRSPRQDHRLPVGHSCKWPLPWPCPHRRCGCNRTSAIWSRDSTSSLRQAPNIGQASFPAVRRMRVDP